MEGNVVLEGDVADLHILVRPATNIGEVMSEAAGKTAM